MTVAAYRPGRIVNLKLSPPSRTAPTDTGVAFMVGIAEKGDPTQPVLIRSMNEYTLYFGARVSNGLLYDSAETFFREGGSKLYLMRVIGPTPVTATKNLNDGAAAILYNVKAKNPGAWGNSIKVGVVAGAISGTAIQVQDAAGNILEQSPDLVVKADAINWSVLSNYITITDPLTGAFPPAIVAPAVLTGSATGDETNATETQWLNALNLISSAYGPGQVMMPGRTTDAAHLNLLAHCAVVQNNRVALLDVADSATPSTLQTSAATAAAGSNGKYGGMFAPFLTIPGLVPNTVRTIPPSPFVAALMARNDSQNSPAVPAAGQNGQALFVLGVDFSYTDAQRDALNTSGVNVIRAMLGGVRNYGYRTLANPVTEPNWIQLNQTRLYMTIVALSGNILENHLFKLMDGRGIEFSALAGDLIAMLMPFWNDNSLYGADAASAFNVDTSSTVNTPVTIANGELHAQIALRMSNFAELVILDIIKVPVNQNL